MHLDLSSLSIPPADVVPEPFPSDWKELESLWCSYSRRHLPGLECELIRVATSTLRRCRELKAEIVCLQTENERLSAELAGEPYDG